MPSQKGKTAVITGSNSGVGFQAARELARAGCSVILACRDIGKAEAARTRISGELPQAKVEVAALDLADLKSIRHFTKNFLASGRSLDLLINNAGVMALPRRKTTVDGYEMQFGTNHLGHFALTLELLPAIFNAPLGRIVTVSSLAHRGAQIRFEDLSWEKNYNPWRAYRQSKLANLLFGMELQRRLVRSGSKAISVIVHPGVANTNLTANGPASNSKLLQIIFKPLGALLLQPEEQGAWPTLRAATDSEVRGGTYYGPANFFEWRGNPVEVKAEKQAYDEALSGKLWEVSEKLTGEKSPIL